MLTSVSEAVRLVDLRRKFGRVHALDGLSLAAKQGEIYGFLGRNGAGKTTTLRVLMGIVHADQGELTILGERVKRVTIAQKRRIGYVAQEQSFYPWMTAQQLGRFVSAFYPSWDADEYARLLTVLDVPKDRRAAELSGGTRTKLALALALAPRPPLLLLDEPTTGLDPVARREFNDLVENMVRERGITAFLSSHLVDEVQDIATRVGIIQAGKMSIEGEVPVLQASVRKLSAVDGASLEQLASLPAGFTRVREGVVHAASGLWASTTWPEGVVIEALSLEDIFLAFARSDVQIAAEAEAGAA
jgi:ABC-2 type transport system ATP-binding protein